MSLTKESIKFFTPIIDSILAASDLETISEKRIRNGLQAAVDYDLTPHRNALKELITSRFDAFMSKQEERRREIKKEKAPSPQSSPPVRSQSTASASASASTPTPAKAQKSDSGPSKNKLKRSASPDFEAPNRLMQIPHVDDDAAYAAKLQALENSRSRVGPRSTRGAKNRIKPARKKPGPKKSAKRVLVKSDSDLSDDEDVKERKVNRNNAFHKELLLSEPLSALFDGEKKISRPQVVKRIWQYVRDHDLQDPQDKRNIICDSRLRAVFKVDKVHMFTMNKILSQNLFPIEDE